VAYCGAIQNTLIGTVVPGFSGSSRPCLATARFLLPWTEVHKTTTSQFAVFEKWGIFKFRSEVGKPADFATGPNRFSRNSSPVATNPAADMMLFSVLMARPTPVRWRGALCRSGYPLYPLQPSFCSRPSCVRFSALVSSLFVFLIPSKHDTGHVACHNLWPTAIAGDVSRSRGSRERNHRGKVPHTSPFLF
jgi:hypothetical protein